MCIRDRTNDAADTADSQENNDTGKTETPTADASIVIGDGNSEVVDFGTVISGQEDSIQAQYVTVTNTGNTTLNFTDISPEHFMVQDISDPMEQNSSQQLWIVPRAGIAAGELSLIHILLILSTVSDRNVRLWKSC